MDIPASVLDFSLVRGGLVAYLRHREHYARRGRMDARVLLVPLLAWLPLLAFTALQGRGALALVMHDARLHVQLLISLPLLLAADPFVDGRLALALRLFITSGLVPESSMPALIRRIEQVTRLRSHPFAEIALFGIAFVFSLPRLVQYKPSWLWTPGGGLTLAGAWCLVVSLPLLRFVLLRWFWRAILWAVLLWHLARTPLELASTHPDRAGGLGFLGPCQACFAPLVLAIACTVASTMQGTPGPLKQDMVAYATPLLVLAGVSIALIFAPLILFIPPLARARRKGTERFAALAAWHSHQFEARWFGGKARAERRAEGMSILGHPDASSLADVGTSFEVERQMRVLPVDKRAVMTVAGAALLPLLPLLVLHGRFRAVLEQLVGAFI